MVVDVDFDFVDRRFGRVRDSDSSTPADVLPVGNDDWHVDGAAVMVVLAVLPTVLRQTCLKRRHH